MHAIDLHQGLQMEVGVIYPLLIVKQLHSSLLIKFPVFVNVWMSAYVPHP